MGDVFDLDALCKAVATFQPDVVLHELTDLPNDPTRIAELGGANSRMRSQGTRNPLVAAKAAGVRGFVAQARRPGGRRATERWSGESHRHRAESERPKPTGRRLDPGRSASTSITNDSPRAWGLQCRQPSHYILAVASFPTSRGVRHGLL